MNSAVKMKKNYFFQNKLIDRFDLCHRAIALMNSIRIKWIATGIGIEKLVMKVR
jgi:transcription-repair coupling factor (superfamily II helicase)